MAQNQSAKIRSMAQRGMTNGEIAKKLGIRYQTVWRTLNRPFEGKVPQQELVASGVRQAPEPLLDEDDEPEGEVEETEETVEVAE
jgi:transposase